MPAPSPDRRPIPYDPAFEILEENEAETAEAIRDQMRKILEITSKDYGHAVRSVHAKSHALLRGEMEVYGALDEAHAQGLFARAGRHLAVLRFSTNPGDILDEGLRYAFPRRMAAIEPGLPARSRLALHAASWQRRASPPSSPAPAASPRGRHLSALSGTGRGLRQRVINPTPLETARCGRDQG